MVRRRLHQLGSGTKETGEYSSLLPNLGTEGVGGSVSALQN